MTNYALRQHPSISAVTIRQAGCDVAANRQFSPREYAISLHRPDANNAVAPVTFKHCPPVGHPINIEAPPTGKGKIFGNSCPNLKGPSEKVENRRQNPRLNCALFRKTPCSAQYFRQQFK
jgi:hypothetical protein